MLWRSCSSTVTHASSSLRMTLCHLQSSFSTDLIIKTETQTFSHALLKVAGYSFRSPPKKMPTVKLRSKMNYLSKIRVLSINLFQPFFRNSEIRVDLVLDDTFNFNSTRQKRLFSSRKDTERKQILLLPSCSNPAGYRRLESDRICRIDASNLPVYRSEQKGTS